MKKWKRTVVYGLLTVMAVGCVGAKAYPVMAEEKEGTAGRYMEKRDFASRNRLRFRRRDLLS